MRRLGVYTCVGAAQDHLVDAYNLLALRGFRPFIEFLYVVTAAPENNPNYAAVKRVADVMVRPQTDFLLTGDGYREVLANVEPDRLAEYDELVLFDSSFFGPLFPLDETFERMAESPCDYWSATYFDTSTDWRFALPAAGGRIPNWNLMVLRGAVFQTPGFQAFWPRLARKKNRWDAFVDHEIAFAKFLHENSFRGETLIDAAKLRSSDPRIFEPDKLIQQRCPVLARELFTSEPMVQDMQALQSRLTLELVRSQTSYNVDLIWQSLLRTQKLRDLQTALDLVSVLPLQRQVPSKKRWNLGPVAVLAHIYYVEMMDEIMLRLDAIPAPFDLFITTATEESRKLIEERLRNFKAGKVDVRVVEHNRGRDMSSLFISLRDVVLSDKYELCLRLHSKRTPQMRPHISESFVTHLFENLLPSRDYVANLFDLLEREPNIGLVIPPVIHIAFGTLGHSWNNNFTGVKAIAKAMGFDVPLDDHTPVAPYGTMFWFRCRALHPLFEHPWKWTDYNAEPHHVDGGLAHVQERAIAYVAQKQGYRTEILMSAKLAGRYYAKLEYKLQLLASCYPATKIAGQYAFALADQKRRRFFMWRLAIRNGIGSFSKNSRMKYPRLWQMSRPVARRVWPVMLKFLT